MNILYITYLFVGFMVSEIPRVSGYSVIFRILLLSPIIVLIHIYKNL